MFALCARSRSVCAIAGAMFAIAGFASIPLYSRSAWEPAAQLTSSRSTQSLPTVGEADVALPPIDDPFARRLPQAPSAPPPSHPGALNSPAPKVVVRAIVSGQRPRALIDDGTTTRVLAPGDLLGSSRIVSIQTEAVVLDDGTHLSVTATNR